MNHPNAAVLDKIYSDFAKNDFTSLMAVCADGMTFQVAGKSKLAGKFTKDTFEKSYIAPMMEMTGNTLKLEVHDILASDRHAVALASQTLVRDDKTVQMRTVHVWRFENGKPVAWYEYPRDLYAYDALFS